MSFTKGQIYAQCKKTAPEFDFDPKLIYAVCLQEGARNAEGVFLPDVARLEQGYYRKYVEKQNELATTSEILLSASYGIMQVMGLSLKKAGYFDWYFNSRTASLQKVLKQPLSQYAIPSGLDHYCVNLELMIHWGCIWMDMKRKLAKGDERKMLVYWNGSSKYPDDVYKRLANIK